MSLARILGIASVAALATGSVLAGSIGGVLFEDTNRNGVADAGEARVVGLTVRLLGEDGSIARTARSAPDGTYLFDALPDGDYLISVVAPSDVRAGLPLRAADPPPVPGLPYGRPRYSAPANLLRNLQTPTGGGFRHMALGDSIAFGFSVCGSLLGEAGYIEEVTARLAGATAVPVVTDKQAIPASVTADLLNPGRGPGNVLLRNDVFHAIGRQTPLVSVSIGGNDFLRAEDGGDAELAEALVTARRNVQEAVSGLTRGIPSADIVINTVYDNMAGKDPLHNSWVPIWNQVLREIAWAQGRRATIAEIHPEYAHDEGGAVAGERGLICNDLLGLDGVHPTPEGYGVHEEKVWQAFGGITLSGQDRLGVNLGLLRRSARVAASAFADITGGTGNPQRGLAVDGAGALVPSGNAEFRLSGFLPSDPPPGVDLSHAVLLIRYRTTAAPIDDSYRFEASLDGSFSAPGTTPSTWNTLLPAVGASANEEESLPLVYRDEPTFRIVAAPLYRGAPTSGAGTLDWDDLRSLTVRAVTVANGTPDAYALEWDGAWLELFTSPATGVTGEVATSPRDPAVSRLALRAALAAGSASPAILEALGEVGTPADLPLLRPLLGSADPLVRGSAVRALARFGGARVREDLIAAVADPDPGVRRAAAIGLEHSSGAVHAGGPWGDLLHDPDTGVRRIAVRAAARGGEPDALLAAVLAGDPDPEVRVVAAAAFLERGEPMGVPVLLDAIAAGDSSRRAWDALARGAPLAEAAAALDDPREAVRAAAIRLTGIHGRPSEPLYERLRPFLDDPAPGPRLAAMDALSRLGDRQSIRAFVTLRQRDGLDAEVVEALARFAAVEAYEELAAIARSDAAPPVVRWMAAQSLARSADEPSRPFLESLRGSPDLRVQRLAAAGLARLEATD